MKLYLLPFLLLAAILFAAAYFTIRAFAVMDFRHDWRTALKDDPEANILFAKRIPSFKKMLWSFKTLKDSNWIPADIRAARYRSEMDPEDREKLDRYLSKDGSRL